MLQNRVFLQEVSDGDGEELATLRVQAMRESLEKVGRFDPHRARERFLSGFSPNDARHVLDSEIRVGFIVVRQLGVELLLDHLYIHPEHQGRGIGSAVLAAVFAQADSLGKNVRVGALKQSRSNEFYVRHGFVAIEQSEFDNYYVRYPNSIT